MTGDKTAEGAAAKLAALKVPTAFVPRPGWPKIIDSSTVKGLNPGLHVVALGVCREIPPYERKLEDGREVYFRWEHHEVLIAKTQAAFPGSYAKVVESGMDACPVWRGPQPAEEAARAAWDRLGSQTDDVPSWLILFDTASDPDTARYFTQRVLELDPSNADALENLAG